MASGESRTSRGRGARERTGATRPVSPAAAQATLTPGVLITFPPETATSVVSTLRDRAGVANVAFAADFADSAVDLGQTAGAGMTVFNTLGVAVADIDPDQSASLAMVAGGEGAAIVEPEPIFFAFDEPPSDFLAYLAGYRDAVNHLHEKLAGTMGIGPSSAAAMLHAVQDTPRLTWGLEATRVDQSSATGRGVRLAVLDTGLDLDHPDFRGRVAAARSFIPDQEVQDENGHGTHCAGTACGALSPSRGRRYGIAHEAELYVGKVLSNQGSALGRSTLAGVEWAVGQGCHIISMSLGSRVGPGQGHLQAFERTAREALRRNCLIIAAAGNDSDRSRGKVEPVGSPANCPSILAVAAVDRNMRLANFSNGGINPDGGIDLAGPGVDVYSSAPDPAPPPQPPFFRQWSAQYDTISGTSMATPHVAGIAALVRQANPSATATDLWRLLVSRARTLPYSASDVGHGLVQC